ncbi:HD domain-containing protein [Aquifex sp.]
MKELADPLYGFVRLNELELKIVDSFPFQRLRYIKQLGVAYLVFPSAQHTRFEHAVGVLNISDKLGSFLPERKRQLLRLAGLLHDLGHPPFSHTTEVLLPKEKTHEDFTERVIRETEVYELLKKEFSEEEIEGLIRITLGKPKSEEEEVLTAIITGEFGADRMDYLRRDAYFCGVSYGFFDYNRLISTLRVEEGRWLVDESGLVALENFLISRYFMYTQVYFHKVVRILSIHLVEFMKKFLKDGDFTDINNYIKLNDASVIARIFENEEFREDFERIFGRKHFRTLLSTESKEEYIHTRERLLTRFPADLMRFDEIFKLPYDKPIYVKKGNRVFRAEEVSSLIASLKPIERYRIYIDRKLWEEAKKLIEN